jgi:two-component system sensor histidine kinase KdpD
LPRHALKLLLDLVEVSPTPAARRRRSARISRSCSAGINVITAMNIQHVESLKPAMKRLTGVDVRETVPDSFLARRPDRQRRRHRRKPPKQ